jgi:hypothetical protein
VYAALKLAAPISSRISEDASVHVYNDLAGISSSASRKTLFDGPIGEAHERVSAKLRVP